MENRETDFLDSLSPEKRALYEKAQKLVARDMIRKKLFNLFLGMICGVAFLVIDFCLSIIPLAIIQPKTIFWMGVSFFSFFIIFMGLLVAAVVILAKNAGKLMKEVDQEKTGLL